MNTDTQVQEGKTLDNPIQLDLPDEVGLKLQEIDSLISNAPAALAEQLNAQKGALLRPYIEAQAPHLLDGGDGGTDDDGDEGQGNAGDGGADDDDDDDSDPLGIRKQKQSKGQEKISFKSVEDVNNFIKKKFGVDNAETFFTSSVPTWRRDAQNASVMSKKYEELAEGLKNLPKPFTRGIQALQRGADWKKEILSSMTAPNYDSDFESQKMAAINHYVGDDYAALKQKIKESEDDEEIRGYQGQIAALEKVAEKHFIADKKLNDSERIQAEKDLQERRKAFETSVQDSVGELKKMFPGAKDKLVSQIAETLSNPDKLIGNFLNEDGTIRKEAAQRLMFALHGQSYLGEEVKTAASKAASKAREEFIDRSKSKKATGPDDNPKETSEEKLDRFVKQGVDSYYGVSKRSKL